MIESLEKMICEPVSQLTQDSAAGGLKGCRSNRLSYGPSSQIQVQLYQPLSEKH